MKLRKNKQHPANKTRSKYFVHGRGNNNAGPRVEVECIHHREVRWGLRERESLCVITAEHRYTEACQTLKEIQKE